MGSSIPICYPYSRMNCSRRFCSVAPSPCRRSFKPVMFTKQQSRTNSLYFPLKGSTDDCVKAKTFQINKYEPVLVCPAGRTYSGLYYLSRDDQIAMYPLEIIYSYKGDGMESSYYAEVIKQALSEVLVHFYPFAGKLATNETGNYVVNCTGEGVYFVEAFVEHDLEEFGDITIPDAPKLRPLLHHHEGSDISTMPLLTVQVTTFTCGGFIIGTKFNHCMMDAESARLFMISWAEMARGLPLSVQPFLDRSLLKPKQVRQTELPQHLLSNLDSIFCERRPIGSVTMPQEERVVNTSVHFCAEKLIQLKRQVMVEGVKRIPTNAELVTAFMWRAIKRSQPRRKILTIPISTRNKFGPLFPTGYFGNCVGNTYVRCNSEDDLLESSLASIVKQVQDAVDMVTIDYVHALSSYVVSKGLQYSSEKTFIFCDISRLAMQNANFGCGGPEQVALATFPHNAVFLLPQKKEDRNSVTAVLSLPSSAMQNFQNSMK